MDDSARNAVSSFMPFSLYIGLISDQGVSVRLSLPSFFLSQEIKGISLSKNFADGFSELYLHKLSGYDII